MSDALYSWCDKLAAVPGVGFVLDAHFASGASIITALSPILDPLFEDEKQKFTNDKIDAFSIQFTTDDGFLYGVDHNRVSVTFQHKLRTKSVSLGPPIMEMLSRPAPYTELLPSVASRAIDATLLLQKQIDRKVQRIGVIAQGTVDEDDLPPGIVLFLKYLRRPWNDVDRGFVFQFTSKLGEDDNGRDRCVHTMIRSEIPSELIVFSFDFQRIYKTGQLIDRSALNDLFQNTRIAALRYFEELAEGSRFDEDIIKSTR